MHSIAGIEDLKTGLLESHSSVMMIPKQLLEHCLRHTNLLSASPLDCRLCRNPSNLEVHCPLAVTCQITNNGDLSKSCWVKPTRSFDGRSQGIYHHKTVSPGEYALQMITASAPDTIDIYFAFSSTFKSQGKRDNDLDSGPNTARALAIFRTGHIIWRSATFSLKSLWTIAAPVFPELPNTTNLFGDAQSTLVKHWKVTQDKISNREVKCQNVVKFCTCKCFCAAGHWEHDWVTHPCCTILIRYRSNPLLLPLQWDVLNPQCYSYYSNTTQCSCQMLSHFELWTLNWPPEESRLEWRAQLSPLSPEGIRLPIFRALFAPFETSY